MEQRARVAAEAIAASQKRYRQPAWEARVRLPRIDEPLEQDEEWCEIEEGGSWRRLRFHDYGDLYSRPGLYEHLFYGLLACRSPERVASLLADVVADGEGVTPLRVLDLGAGNGMLGEELKSIGAAAVFGADILPEAKAATERDRPGVYDDYFAGDLSTVTPEIQARIEGFQPTCLSCVAALGFGDVPPRVYYNALSFIPKGGLLAFNIKSDFLDPRYAFGFSELIRRMVGEQMIRFESVRRYQHRFSVRGEPLYYTAIIATKLAEVPASLLVDNG